MSWKERYGRSSELFNDGWKGIMRRLITLLLAVTLIATAAIPVLAADQGNWTAGCSSGYTCWYETTGGYMKADQRDSYTFNDWYAGDGNKSIGWHTDLFRNRMNWYRAYLYQNSNYSSYLWCVNPGSTSWYNVGGTTTTGSWKGFSGSLPGCRS